jgi:4-oxalmesaconate hydratase
LLVVDCHGHFTTEPPQLAEFRRRQLAALEGSGSAPQLPEIPDEELMDCIGDNQLRVMDERGIDMVLFSPRASGMGHHVPDAESGVVWTRLSNDLVHRVSTMFPERFAPVAQLPQTPSGDLGASVGELRRCVEQLGFVAFNLNPDPSGGHWSGRPVTDSSWFPLYEAMEQLDVPAMIHVSASCNPNFHALGAHYLNADTTVFMQLLEGDLFDRFPGLRFVIPHGGGAVPYHWGRYKGLAARFGLPPIESHLMGNVYFDTCVYHRPGIELLLEVAGPANVLFGSEMLGAVRGVNPETGSGWDDTRRYVDSLGLPEDVRRAVYEENARRVYPRLDRRLRDQGR